MDASFVSFGSNELSKTWNRLSRHECYFCDWQNRVSKQKWYLRLGKRDTQKFHVSFMVHLLWRPLVPSQLLAVKSPETCFHPIALWGLSAGNKNVQGTWEFWIFKRFLILWDYFVLVAWCPLFWTAGHLLQLHLESFLFRPFFFGGHGGGSHRPFLRITVASANVPPTAYS